VIPPTTKSNPLVGVDSERPVCMLVSVLEEEKEEEREARGIGGTGTRTGDEISTSA
jgi:hypothetical protein